MRSRDWLKSAGKVTAGVGVVVAPATAAIAIAQATPAAAWTSGHTYTFATGYTNKQTTGISRSGAVTASHSYRGWTRNSSPRVIEGHLEFAVYASGWHSYNALDAYLGNGGVQSIVKGKWKNAHSEKIWWWENLHAGGFNSHGYFEMSGF